MKQALVHLILAFVKGVTEGPNSANEPADSPQLFCAQVRRAGRERQRQPLTSNPLRSPGRCSLLDATPTVLDRVRQRSVLVDAHCGVIWWHVCPPAESCAFSRSSP